MRVLMLVFVKARQGAYWRALHLARSLAARGHQVVLMAVSPQRRLGFRQWDTEGVTVVETPDLLRGPLRSGWDLWDCLSRIWWLRKRHFDLVHIFDARPVTLLPSLCLRYFRHVPLIMDWEDWLGRGGSVEERPNAIIRWMLRPVETFFEERFRTLADGSTVICTTLRDKALRLGVCPDRMLFLRDGADTQGLAPLDRDTSRQILGLPPQAPMIAYVGAIFYRDASLMSQAFDIVHSQLPAARLLLLGYVTFPVEAMVRTPAAVVRSGIVDQLTLNRYLAASDVCWLPFMDSGANRGRWPLKLCDYMCVGRATVATAVGDVAQVMQQYRIGLLVPPTPAGLAAGVLDLLAQPGYRAVLGSNARRVAEEAFDWRLRAEQLEAFYGKILSRNTRLAQ